MHSKASLTSVKYLFLGGVYFSFLEKESKQAPYFWSEKRRYTAYTVAQVWIEGEVQAATLSHVSLNLP